jgi:hypothetical protein
VDRQSPHPRLAAGCGRGTGDGGWASMASRGGNGSSARRPHWICESAPSVGRASGAWGGGVLTVDFGTPSYKFTVNICTYLIF